MQVQKQTSLWAKSTEARINYYLDQFLFKYIESSVRVPTRNLFHSLFKKGDTNQRKQLIQELTSRMAKMDCVGKASQQIFGLVGDIIKQPGASQCQDELAELLKVLRNCLSISLNRLTSSQSHKFFRFCEDMLTSSTSSFNPCLFELNGCIKCYGDVENTMTTNLRKIDEITEDLMVNSNRMTYRLKMQYELKDLILKPQKPPNRQSNLIIWYFDDKTGMMTRLGQYLGQPMSMTTNQIVIQFENVRSSGNCKCTFCNRPQQNAIVCSNCRRQFDIQLRYKRLGGDSQRIMKELSDNYRQLMAVRSKADSFYEAVKNQTTLPSSPLDITELQRIYSQIILNLSLLDNNGSRNFSEQYTFTEGKWNCYSCCYIQTTNILSFIAADDMIQLLQKYDRDGFIQNILDILGPLFREDRLAKQQHNKIVQILSNIINHSPGDIRRVMSETKDNRQAVRVLQCAIVKKKMAEGDMQQLTKVCLDVCAKLQPTLKTEMLSALLASKDDLEVLSLTEPKLSEKLKSVKRLTQENIEAFLPLLNFNKRLFLQMPVTPSLLLLMASLPVQLLPSSSIDDCSETLIPYIANHLPEFNKNLATILSPHPMLPLNSFSTLPALAKSLAPSEGLKLVKEILKFKKMWNINLYNTLSSCDYLIDTLQRDEQLRMCLQGLSNVYEEYFLMKIHKILVPKRKQFVIRIDPPEKQLKKASMDNSGWEYQIIPVREVKTEDLPGFTMKEVRDWISKQLRIPMAMDLIVDQYVIDDVDVPIEMVWKKVTKQSTEQMRKNINQVENLKVIYWLRGVIGEPTERAIGQLVDEQKDLCLSYAHILTEKLPNASNCCGLDIIFKLFKKFEKSQEDQATRKLLLEILNMVCKVEAVRVKAIENNYVDILIRATLKALSSKDEVSDQFSSSLLQTVDKLIDQANISGTVNARKVSQDRKGSVDMDIEEDKTADTASKNVQLVLTKITQDDEHQKSKRILELIKLLPFSSKDIPELSQKIYNYLKPLDNYQSKNKNKLQRLYALLDALPETYTSFKELCYERGLIPIVLESLNEIFPQDETVTQENLMLYESQLLINLAILKNLVKGYQPLQKDLLQGKMINKLHRLSMVIGKKANVKITTAAESIIKYLAEKPYAYAAASHEARELLENQKNENKRRAQAAKKAAMEEMRRKRANAVQKAAVEAPTRKDYLTCLYCKAGYEEKNNILGLYALSSKTDASILDGWWQDTKKFTTITSLTTFTVIHFECHRQAQSYNSQEKKTEWEGAQMRNQEAKCNNWVPIRGPPTTEQEFEKISRKYFEHNKSGNFWVVICDLKGLMARLSGFEDLPKDSNGSYPNNMKLMAALLHFASGLIKKSEDQKYVQQGVTILRDKTPETPEQLQFYLTCSLFTTPFKKYEQWRDNAYNKISSCISTYYKDHREPFTVHKPFLLYLLLSQFIFENIHIHMDKEQNDVPVGIEQYVSKNLESVLTAFEKYASIFKDDTKRKTLAEMEECFRKK